MYPDYSEGGYPDSRILDALLPQYGSWSGPCQGEKVAKRTVGHSKQILNYFNSTVAASAYYCRIRNRDWVEELM